MQNGIQPRPVTAQTPNAHPLNGTIKNQLLSTLNEGAKKKMYCRARARRASQTDSLSIPARHVPRLADRSLPTRGTLDRDGGVAKGDPVIDITFLLLLAPLRLGVFHRRFGGRGFVC